MKRILSFICVLVTILGATSNVFAIEYELLPLDGLAEQEPVTAEEDGLVLDVIGDPITNMDEGNLNYVYWSSRMSGNGATCWIELDYATTASTLKTSLTIERSDGYWHFYDYKTYTTVKHNDNYCYTLWNDGLSYVALSASGKGYINGTQVTSMAVSGWW